MLIMMSFFQIIFASQYIKITLIPLFVKLNIYLFFQFSSSKSNHSKRTRNEPKE